MNFTDFLNAQPALVALGGTAILGGAMFGLRQVPVALWNLVRERLSVTLRLESDQEVYHHVNFWLSRHGQARTARRLMMQHAYDYEARRWEWAVTLGAGWHLLRHAGSWILLHRHVAEESGLERIVGPNRRETLTLTTIGTRQAALRSLLAQAQALYFGDGLVKVFYWRGGGYQLADRREPRPLSTVFLPVDQTARIVARIERFLAERALYQARGVPWRFGALFEGESLGKLGPWETLSRPGKAMWLKRAARAFAVFEAGVGQ